MQRHLKAKLLIFTTGFSTHPSSFTQHVVTKEVLISHFWDAFEEAMLRLKEFGSFENSFWDRGESTDSISLQRRAHSDFHSSNWHCSALLQTLTVHMGHTEDMKLQPLPWEFLFMMEFLSDSKIGEQGENTVLWGQLTALTTGALLLLTRHLLAVYVFRSHDLLGTKIWDKSLYQWNYKAVFQGSGTPQILKDLNVQSIFSLYQKQLEFWLKALVRANWQFSPRADTM